MAEFREERLDVNGVETGVLLAGAGEPLVFFHGGGVLEGFECLLPLAERFSLIAPYHPGFGSSGDDPAVEGVGDLVRHYLELFDALGVETMALVGHSLGGWLAAWFAIDHPRRIRRLVLASPAGLSVPGHPAPNVPALEPGEIYRLLTADESVFAGRIPEPLDEPFLAARSREGQAIGRLRPTGPEDPKLARWLHRLQMPTLLMWGEEDKVVPAAYLSAWEALLPNAKLSVYPGRGHLLFWEDPQPVAAVAAFASEP
jgi:pimeloyl-ACP methyl ester carboxylesterase